MTGPLAGDEADSVCTTIDHTKIGAICQAARGELPAINFRLGRAAARSVEVITLKEIAVNLVACDGTANQICAGDRRSGDIGAGDGPARDIRAGDTARLNLRRGDCAAGDLASGDAVGGDVRARYAAVQLLPFQR